MTEREHSLSISLPSLTDAELKDRIAWLIQLRWLAMAGTLLAILVAATMLPRGLPLVPLVSTTGFIGLYNLIFLFYHRSIKAAGVAERQAQRAAIRMVYAQIVLDLTCLTLLLHFAGGVENPFWAFYVLHVIIASILLSRRAAFGCAGVATLLYGGMVMLEYFGIVPHVNLYGLVDAGQYQQVVYLIASGVAFVTTLSFAAMMATSIVARLRRREAELIQSNAQCEVRSGELAELNRRLAEADATRKRFLMLVTHELRAPVAAIQSYVRLLLGGYVPADKQQEILEKADRRASEQLERINDLLVLSQLRDKLTKTEEVDLVKTLNQVLELLRPAAEEKKLRLSVEVDPRTPAVIASHEQILHVWTNLISNAIKYTPAGGSVWVRVGSADGMAQGSVQDTGIGIAAEEQSKIFEEFYRTPAAKEFERHGTGLGLSIVKEIVEGYGGRIGVVSAPGEGSTFTFVLPAAGGEPAKP